MTQKGSIHILILGYILCATSGYDWKCPHKSQRTPRILSLCNGNTTLYTCLYNTKKKAYAEFCSTKNDFVRSGLKYVISGTFRNIPCATDRFQPIRFWSNKDTNCLFSKTKCSSIGQVIHDKTSTQHDVTCRCDYNWGYMFVASPKNRCFCNPTEEDCSCFIKKCPDQSKLSQDYECISLNETNKKFSCQTISVRDISNRRPEIMGNIQLEDKISFLEQWKICTAIVVVIFICVKIIVFLLFETGIKKLLRNSCKEHPNGDEKEKYMRAIQSGNEVRQYVRIQVIGKDGVGKSSLVCRLLGKPIKGVKRTDGIEINRTCQIRRSDGEWIVGEVATEMENIKMRIHQAVNMKQEGEEPVFDDHGRVSDTEKTPYLQKGNPSEDHSLSAEKNEDESLLSIRNDNESMKKDTKNLHGATNNSLDEKELNLEDTVFSPDKQKIEKSDKKRILENCPKPLNLENTDKIFEAVIDSMDDIFSYVKNKEKKKTLKDTVECGIWDFAGQRDYYATHQTFFTPHAIYILVVDIEEDITPIQYDGKFDFDSSGGQSLEVLVPSFDSHILVVGPYGAGKTTLVSNLISKSIPKEIQDTYHADGIDVGFRNMLFDLKTQKFLKKTKGVHSFHKVIYQKVVSYLKSESTDLFDDHEVIPIPVIDIAGQIVYHATHQTFITSHGIYLVTFNGSRELDDPLCDRDDEGKITILENIRQWVSSILLYSHPDNKNYPKLMFVATHKDLVCQEDISNRRAQLLNTLSACFTDESIKSHLMLQHLFFVNGSSKDDPEMDELSEWISTTITENPQWGQKVPKQFLILEMMFAALVEEGVIIITLEDAEKINTTTGVKPLSTAELGLFLTVQNICGKMTYIDYPSLRNFIVIDPTCLIDVLKSIVTSVPVIASLHQGRLTKSDLTKIWSSEKFSHFLQHEEYFRQLLVHYDILSEVRRYDRESGKKIAVDCYLVPCMITSQNKSTFVEKHITFDKCVGFVFAFNATDVPDAIPCRLIASILRIWKVKNYENVDLIFPGFVAVVLDRKHDLVVKTERNTVAVYIVHKERKELIIKDLASCVRECLEQNLAKISEVYSLSFTSDNITKRYVPFHVKLKSGCLAPNCLLDAENVNSIGTSWVCNNHGYVTPKSELEIWYTDRTTFQCTDSCQGIPDAVLSTLLNDSQLLCICKSLTKEEVRSLAFNLGVSSTKLDAIGSDSISMIKFYSLRICREKNKSCRDFIRAMEAAEVNRHTMCQILRQEEMATDLPDKILNMLPSDEMLDKLCLRIGKEWMVLGLELGIEIERLEQIEYDNPKVLWEISRQMLYCWRNREDNSTIRELLHALERSGKNPHLITEILENCESFPKLIPVD